MNDVMKKISRKKVAVASMIVVIVVFSVAYAIIQTRTAFAILTTPPPGILGPYYVTAEAKIYGPVVDLAAIKNKTGGQYASSHYTYVQWGGNPFYRVYADNTFQEAYSGQMMDIADQFSPWGGYVLETNLRNTYDSLKNDGALDPSSAFGGIYYFGNMPGTFIGMNPAGTFNINITTTSWKAAVIHARTGGHDYWYNWQHYVAYYPSHVRLELNGTQIIDYTSPSDEIGPDHRLMNASGLMDGVELYNWTLTIDKGWEGGDGAVTLYLEEISHFETTMPISAYRIYVVVDSPGTGFVSKYVSPSSPVAGSTISVTVRLDPPSAGNMNITDLYPNVFTWASVDVLLEKFRVGTGLVDSAYVNVVPTPDGSNMKFTVYYNQAPSILQSLLSDEYIYLTYSLRVPDTAGEYTLPAATMSYLIPSP